MKLKAMIAATALAVSAPAVQAHDYINQVAQARDSLVQAENLYGSIACDPSSPKSGNMATCPFADAIYNGLKWIDEIKPGDTNQEAKRKLRNAGSVMSLTRAFFQAAWDTPMVKKRHSDFAIAETFKDNIIGYLGLLYTDPKIHTEPVPTLESVTKRLEQN